MNINPVRAFGLRTVIALVAIVAVALGISNSVGKANATELQPTNATITVTDVNKNPVTVIDTGNTYIFTLEIGIPDAAKPGDTVTITLHQGFEANSNVGLQGLGDGSTASVNGNTVTFALGDGVLNKKNISAGITIAAIFKDELTPGQEIPGPLTIGKNSTYSPTLTFGQPGPGESPMIINKWSGLSSDTAVQKTEFKLDDYKWDFAWVKAGEKDIFAHWFVQLNNFYNGDPAQLKFEPILDDMGSDITVTDTFSGVPGYTPVLYNLADGQALTFADADNPLDGVLIEPSFELKVREQQADGSIKDTAFGLRMSNGGQLPIYAPESDYFFITTNADNSYSFTFSISKYLAQSGYTAAKNAQYSLGYFTVISKESASITNDATFESSKQNKTSDGGFYKYVDENGWIKADQATTMINLYKEWKGLSTGETPAATFTLLADGQPAQDVNGNKLPDAVVTVKAPDYSYSWTNLPTQSAQGVAITYTVKETSIEGFTAGSQSQTFTPDLNDLDNSAVHNMYFTNTKDVPQSSETPTPVVSMPQPTTSVTSSSSSSTPSVSSVISSPEPSITSSALTSSEPAPYSTPNNDGDNEPSSKIPWWVALIPIIPVALVPFISSFVGNHGSSQDKAPVSPVTPPAAAVAASATPSSSGELNTYEDTPTASVQPAPAPTQSRGNLANTGANVLWLGGLAVFLIIAGVGALFIRRRED